jgi:hypothetical protein
MIEPKRTVTVEPVNPSSLSSYLAQPSLTATWETQPTIIA